jgi:hypothetical protein
MIRRSHVIIILSIFFLLKIFWIFNAALDEDELAYLKHAYLVMNGAIPFVDFGDSPFLLFQFFLIPILWPFKFQTFSILWTRLFLLLLSHAGLVFYYLSLKKIFSKDLALWSTLLLGTSCIFCKHDLMIRQANIALPLLFFLIYFFLKNPFFFRVSSIALLTLFFCFLDPRMMIFIATGIGILLFYKKISSLRYIFTLMILGGLLVFLLSFLDYKTLKYIFLVLYKLFPNMPEKPDLTFGYLLKYTATEWLLIYFFLCGLKNNPPLQRYYGWGIGIFGILLVTVLKVFRPYTLLLYLLPFIVIPAGKYFKQLIYQLSGYRKKIILSLILCLGILNPIYWINKEKMAPPFPLKTQLQLINKISALENQNYQILNLGRYAYNLFSTNNFPLLRLEEDAGYAIWGLHMDIWFNLYISHYLIEVKPEYLLFELNDSFFRRDTINFINTHYKKIDGCLYKRKAIFSEKTHNTPMIKSMIRLFFKEGRDEFYKKNFAS